MTVSRNVCMEMVAMLKELKARKQVTVLLCVCMCVYVIV